MRSVFMNTVQFAMQFQKENLEKYITIKDDKDVWFYRTLAVLLKFKDHAETIEEVLHFDVEQPLKNVVGGTGSLQAISLNLSIAFSVDEMLVRKFFGMIKADDTEYKIGENGIKVRGIIETDDEAREKLPDISIKEYCSTLVDFLHFHGRKEMKI